MTAGPLATTVAGALRVDVGFPRFGVDITDNNLPQEVNRNAAAISFTKGCYLGQETIARIDAVGHVNQQLVKLEFPNQRAEPRIEMPVFHRDTETIVGRITSCARLPAGPVAIALVKRTAIESGSELHCEAGVALIS